MRIRRPFLTLTLLIVLAISGIYRPASWGGSTPAAPSDERNPWGVSFGAEIVDPNSPRALEWAGKAGIGFVRFTMGQERIERKPGFHDFQRHYDKIMAKARSVGLIPLVTLGFTPRWNSAAPPNDPDYLNFPPEDYDAFGRYVYESVRHYPWVLYWEIWNEPDLPGSWRGTPAEYARLLAVAYHQVKRANSRAKVLLGGLALDGQRVDPDFLEDILTDARYPAARSFDIMNFHIYDLSKMRTRMDYIRTTLARHGASDKPIWVTETGYPSDPLEQQRRGLRNARFRGAEGQAAWLRQALPFLRSFKVEKVFWFKLFDSDKDADFKTCGLLDYGAQPKPAYEAYREVILRARAR